MFQHSHARGLLRLAALRDTTEAQAEMMSLYSDRFARLADPSSAPRALSSFNLFQTPEQIAARMTGLADLSDGIRVLEPSAGLGRIYSAIRARSSCFVQLVEIDKPLCGELYRMTDRDDNAGLVESDFLAWQPSEPFDRVVMNPPFKRGTDIRHIMHARTMLAPGGFIVSLLANGSKQFQQLRPLADHWEPLPARSFASEGTGVDVVLAVFRSPA